MPMTRRHITVVIAVELIAAFATGLVIVDLRAHAIRQAERDVNMWGYRGEPRLRAVDLRVAVVGGSAAFGYGVDWEHSLTYYLDGDLKRHARKINELLQIDVVNLAAVGDGAASVHLDAADLRLSASERGVHLRRVQRPRSDW